MFSQGTIEENRLHVNLRLVIPFGINFVNKTGLKLLVKVAYYSFIRVQEVYTINVQI